MKRSQLRPVDRDETARNAKFFGWDWPTGPADVAVDHQQQWFPASPVGGDRCHDGRPGRCDALVIRIAVPRKRNREAGGRGKVETREARPDSGRNGCAIDVTAQAARARDPPCRPAPPPPPPPPVACLPP